MALHTETLDGITYTLDILPEDVPVRGNALASGDDKTDRAAEDEILARLESGDNWAWCCVSVTAEVNGFEASTYLGACSYDGLTDFLHPDGYYPSMREEAREALITKLESACEALSEVTP
jgi:hypothetical protein